MPLVVTATGTQTTIDIQPTEAGQTVLDGKFGTETIGVGGDDLAYRSATGSNGEPIFASSSNLFIEVQQFIALVAKNASPAITPRAAIFRIQQVLRAMLEQAPC